MDATPHSPRATPAGRLHIQAEAARLFLAGDLDLVLCLRRHLSGDYGDLTETERRENNYVMENGGEIFSAYRINDSLTVWIVSEWDLCVSTVTVAPTPAPPPLPSPKTDGMDPEDIQF